VRFLDWLNRTASGRLVILEIGAGFSTPSVIRWPCESIARTHPDACLIRINPRHAAVPATAILHLHDRDWVYEPLEAGRFRRAEVVAGNMLPNNRQEIVSGLKPGDRVVANALVLQNTMEQ